MQTCKERTGKDHGRNKRTCLSDLKTPFDFLFHPISFTCLAVLPSVCVFFGFSVGLSPCQAFRPVFCPFGFFDLFLYFGIFWSFSFLFRLDLCPASAACKSCVLCYHISFLDRSICVQAWVTLLALHQGVNMFIMYPLWIFNMGAYGDLLVL